ncbi:MAG: efflux RND transporter periplasmic adaptor subunit, partial [Candidatus Latescibacterota bacterium]
MQKKRPFPPASIRIAIPAVALLIGGCGGEEPEESASVVRPVKTLVIQSGLRTSVSFPGTVQGAQRMMVSFRVRGRLIEFPVDEGQNLTQGTLIARLDPRDYEIAVDEARAQFTRAEADFQRYQRLYEREAVPLSQLDARRAQRDVTKAKLDEAEKNLSYTWLYAPFDGEVGQKLVQNFEVVQAQQGILDFHGVEALEIVINLPEAYRAMFQTVGVVNVAMRASFDFAPGREYELTLKEVSASADPATRTYRTTFAMPQPEGVTVRPGMTATVRLVVDTSEQEIDVDEPIVIPATAVAESDAGGFHVWVVDPNELTVHKRVVQVGRVTGEADIEIIEGLEHGERIAVAAVSHLREGMKIRL